MSTDDPLDVLSHVEAHYVAHFGPHSGRASVTFLGTEGYEVLRFTEARDGLIRYATVGASRRPLVSAVDEVVETVSGPRVELVLEVRAAVDTVARQLAVLAASNAVDAAPLVPGASFDLGHPLWEGARFTAAMLGDEGSVLPALELADDAHGLQRGPVGFLPVLPLTSDEAALKRAQGREALEELWLHSGADLRDPGRT